MHWAHVPKSSAVCNTFIMLRSLLVLFLFLSLACCGGGSGGSNSSGADGPGSSNAPRVGAHYYLWFPQKFKEGFLRNKLKPRQEPQLGIYNSSSRDVVEQHISQASQHGINFFTLLYSPTQTQFNGAITETFLQARNLGNIEFCIFYGTNELGPNFGGLAEINNEAKQRFYDDLTFFADNLFPHPQYLKVDGKPVLILYLTRTLVGGYAEMFRQGRELLRAKGIEVFFLADEIYWLVTGHREGGDTQPHLSAEPQTERMKLFDGIFAYNLYEAGLIQHQGYGADSAFISDIDSLYRRYRSALPSGVSFVPYAMPGYNDRGVRLREDHFAIPRELSLGAGEGSFFREFIQRLVYPYFDSRNNLALITSWNEWSEDTAIEPAAPSEATTQDVSSSETDYTQGYSYSGYGNNYLEIVRDSF